MWMNEMEWHIYNKSVTIMFSAAIATALWVGLYTGIACNLPET
jgi:hypothetical protein